MLDKVDSNLDNPRFKEAKQFKAGGEFSVSKTVDFFPGKKKSTKKKKVLFG